MEANDHLPRWPDDGALCDRCGADLNGQCMTHYGEALCDPCYDAVDEELIA